MAQNSIQYLKLSQHFAVHWPCRLPGAPVHEAQPLRPHQHAPLPHTHREEVDRIPAPTRTPTGEHGSSTQNYLISNKILADFLRHAGGTWLLIIRGHGHTWLTQFLVVWPFFLVGRQDSYIYGSGPSKEEPIKSLSTQPMSRPVVERVPVIQDLAGVMMNIIIYPP